MPNGGGRGGRKGREAGDRDDTPEPPPKKRVLTNEDREMISMIKARQQELKKFFQTVGTQQTNILDLLASRDIAKMSKKPRAHKKVPEYDMVMNDLNQTVSEESDLFRKRHDMDVEYAKKLLGMEKEIIEKKFRVGDYSRW